MTPQPNSADTMECTLINPVCRGAVRGSDAWGQGHFGAPRGARRHKGVDIVADEGAAVCSPLDGRVLRLAYPYEDTSLLSGVLLEGVGAYAGLAVKIFYLRISNALLGDTVGAGAYLGQVQCLQTRYPGITNHIHLEVRRDGELVDLCVLIPLLG